MNWSGVSPKARSSTCIWRWRLMAAISKACAPPRWPISARSRAASVIGEAALLVALPQAPEARRPDRSPAAAKAARDRVLDRALAAHLLGPAEARMAKAENPPLARKNFPTLARARQRGVFPRPSRPQDRASDRFRAPASEPRNAGVRESRKARAKAHHGHSGHRQRDRPDPRPCRQRRLFRGSARRRHRHDPGPALAGFDSKTLHLRHGLRRRNRPSRNHARRFPRALWGVEAG